MKFFKKVGRILILTVFIVLASFGMGFGLNYRERFLDKETRIELAQKKEEEGDSEQSEIKE